MRKYIDAKKLKGLIEAEYKKYVDISKQTNSSLQCQYIADGLEIAEELIDDALQQEGPEADLNFEKEMDSFFGVYRKDGKTYGIDDDEEYADWKEDCNPYFEIDLARHFYELGLRNARKEE